MSSQEQNIPPELYKSLKRMASRILGNECSHVATLCTTALVHEACIRLIRQPDLQEMEDSRLIGLAASAMRSIIIDHARKRNAFKRKPKGSRVPLDDVVDLYENRAIDLIALEEALNRLSSVDNKLVRTIDLRFFGGLTLKETAEALNVTIRTVQNDLTVAKTWLRQEMDGKPDLNLQ